MSVYKVFATDMPAALSTGDWPLPTATEPGQWMAAADGPLVLYENGYDLCRPKDLVRCLHASIFEAEYQGEAIDTEHRLLVRQARLVRSVARWTRLTAILFAADCVERVLPLYEARRPGESWPQDALRVAREAVCGEMNLAHKHLATTAGYEMKTAEAAAQSDPVTHAVWKAVRWIVQADFWDRPAHVARFAREAVEAAAPPPAEVASDAELAWQTERLFAYFRSEPFLDVARRDLVPAPLTAAATPTPTTPEPAPSQNAKFPPKGGMRMVGRRSYSVRVIDNFHRHDSDEAFEVGGFPTLAAAREYAIRRVRASIEPLRKPGDDADTLRRAWSAMGEEVVVEGERIGAAFLDRFVAEPPGPGECDYLAVGPNPDA